MNVFSVVEDAKVILYVRGVYKQADVYSRGDRFYAKHGSGFVRLLPHDTTSVPSIRWIDSMGFKKP